jgi:hypothetical protein
MTAPAPSEAPGIEARVRSEVERALQRGVKGLEYISTGDPAVGQTPKDVIYRRGTLQLHHYRPLVDEVYRVPVLLVMSLVSKPYIFDLTPGQSFVEHLVRAGFEVYLIDWGLPRAEHRGLTIDDYVADLLPDCIEQVRATSAVEDVTMLGYCLGGIFTFLMGGITGIFLAVFPIDWQLTDTYFVVAHFHYTAFGASAFGMLAALYFWFPKMSGRMMSEGLGKASALLLFVGQHSSDWRAARLSQHLHVVFEPVPVLESLENPTQHANVHVHGAIACAVKPSLRLKALDHP